jgi:hypothetical protein
VGASRRSVYDINSCCSLPIHAQKNRSRSRDHDRQDEHNRPDKGANPGATPPIPAGAYVKLNGPDEIDRSLRAASKVERR